MNIIKRLIFGEDYNETSVAEHYGMQQEDFEELVDDLISKIWTSRSESQVIDQLFPDLSSEQRIKIFAFYVARKEVQEFDDFKQRKRIGG